MIPVLLPTKGIGVDRALLTVGADILALLATSPTSVSGVWERYKSAYITRDDRAAAVTFDWFSLALTTLFAANLIESMPGGQLRRRSHVSA